MDATRAASMSAEVLCRLARVWRAKGNLAAAASGFERALAVDPHYLPALLDLGGIMLRQGRANDALRCYERALELGPDDETVRFRYDYVRSLVAGARHTWRANESPHARPAIQTASNPHGKIDLRDQIIFRSHRSGWGLALQALMPLHNYRGVLFDGFLERNFGWRHTTAGIRPEAVLERMRREGTFDELATSEEQGITPYTRPWVGLLHNPPNMPSWYHSNDSPQTIFAKSIWQRSMPSCTGLFALSEYHASWLRQETGKPVSVLTFPTEIPAVQFDFSSFMANKQKKIVQVGWWLRKISAIYRLPLGRDNALGYQKIRLVTHFFGDADNYQRQLIGREVAISGVELDQEFAANTREMQHLTDQEYDQLLAENIVFVELYDASANNAVVECIARATPLLINPLPAVREYLGDEYPLYFNDLDEAAVKALDPALIHAAHMYLKNCPTRARLSADHFRHSFETSEVYRLL